MPLRTFSVKSRFLFDPAYSRHTAPGWSYYIAGFYFERLIIVAHHLATASPPLPLLDHLCLRERRPRLPTVKQKV